MFFERCMLMKVYVRLTSFITCYFDKQGEDRGGRMNRHLIYGPASGDSRNSGNVAKRQIKRFKY